MTATDSPNAFLLWLVVMSAGLAFASIYFWAVAWAVWQALLWLVRRLNR